MGKYKERFLEVLVDNTYGVLPAPISSQVALQVLVEYLLGEDWCVALPASQEQINTAIVDNILQKYSREYRKDLKKLDALKEVAQ